MQKHFISTLFFSLLFIAQVAAQTTQLPLTLVHWDTVGLKVFSTEVYKGKESLLFGPGFIEAKGIDLRDGVIEADISFPQQRMFPGIHFRVKDRQNFESFYFRPHQSGNPDATQYTPVFNGEAGWQFYYGEGYSAAMPFRFNEWHHLKIDLHGLQAEIYVDNMDKPLTQVKELLSGWHGGTLAFISTGAPIRIANVQYTKKTVPEPGPITIPLNGTNGLITQWQISNGINRKSFDKIFTLTPAIKKGLTWKTVATESSGILNLNRYAAVSDSTNCMVAKLTIESASEKLTAITFGFSDFVTVYLNDKALYSGADPFQSRDYRFLGTVGYFDTLALPLKKGTNEIWFVLSENFGGWGVRAKLDDMSGLKLK